MSMILKKAIPAALFSIVLLAGTALAAFDTSSIRGPKISDLYMVIYRDPDAQVLALEKGDLDILGDITRPVDVERLSNNPDVSLSIARGFHIFFLGFNLREFPWNDPDIRRAVSAAIPKTRFVRELFSGYCTPVDTYLPPVSPYYEPEVTTRNYDPLEAREMLKQAGWTWNGDNVLVSPQTGEALKPVTILAPAANSAPTTAELSNRIAAAMVELGIPVTVDPYDFSTMLKRLDSHDFDLFVLAWSLTRDPDNLFAFFHSSMDVEGGYNIQGLHDADVDKVTEDLRWAPDRASAERAASRAQKLLSEKNPWVPIYSRFMIAAVRNDWKGVVTTKATAADNIWTLLNVQTASGAMRPLSWCLPEEPRSLNPLTAGSAYDWQVLGLVYDGMIAVEPETLEDIPWLAIAWETETVTGDDGPHTRLTFSLRKGVTWHDGEPFTASDVKATLLFLKEHKIPRYFDMVRDLESVETPDDLTLVVDMSTVSYWHLHNVGGCPVLPAHILENITDWQSWKPANQKNPLKPEITALVGTGPFVFREYRAGEYVHLTRFEDFWMLKEH